VIDSHCHLAGEAFTPDLDEVIGRARAVLERVLVVLSAGDAAEAAQAGRIVERWPETVTAVGVHPHAAGPFAGDPEGAAALVRAQIARTPSARAVGEIGLDYHYDFAPRDVQQQVFRAQLRLARELDLPVVIHTREAEDDTIRILGEEGGTRVRGVLHCFTGSAGMARAALGLGLYVSFAGIITFPKAGEQREVAASVPADRLLVETDSPYLAPVPHRGRRNEPARVALVAETLAELRGERAADVAARTTENFHALFRP
jgi:TatD DNase family protein